MAKNIDYDQKIKDLEEKQKKYQDKCLEIEKQIDMYREAKERKQSEELRKILKENKMSIDDFMKFVALKKQENTNKNPNH